MRGGEKKANTLTRYGMKLEEEEEEEEKEKEKGERYVIFPEGKRTSPEAVLNLSPKTHTKTDASS